MPIGSLRRLVDLNLNHSRGCESLSFINQLESLEILDVSYLYLTAFPDIFPGHLNYSLLKLNFSRNNIQELHPSIGYLQKLVSLDVSWCKTLKRLPESIYTLRCLKTLNLESCAIQELSEGLGHLESLTLSNTHIKQLPNSICMLKHLKTLLLAFCYALRSLPQNFGLLESLDELVLSWCNIKYVPSCICKLKHLRVLNFSGCSQLERLPETLGDLKCLERLNVEGTCISHLPHSISLLKGLKVLGSETLLESNPLMKKTKRS